MNIPYAHAKSPRMMWIPFIPRFRSLAHNPLFEGQ